MEFKADTSFLRFLSMGAAGARQTMAQMRAAGFEPIELERYCTSNKIWTTKVKRLRLPDILCVRTGLRVEVRAKSDLKIRMSDAPANPDRRWNTGLRDNDLCAFIACADDNGTPVPAAEAVFFTVEDLFATEGTSQLGPPKSASEGAERDRTWASIVPSRNGVVDDVNASVLRVTMDGEEGRSPRSQTYQLRGKISYVQAGERFVGKASILAGTPLRRAQLDSYQTLSYDPLGQLDANNPVDRYAAVKSLPFRVGQKMQARALIEARLNVEPEDRVLLEAAGAGTALGSIKAQECLGAFIWDQERADLRMEAVFILTELRNPSAREILLRIANDPRFVGDEIRQAAVWGLGKAGLSAFTDLVSFVGDEDRGVALHAIAGFGNNVPTSVIDHLIADLVSADRDRAPAASTALRNIGSDAVLNALITSARQKNGGDGWVLATLGRLPEDKVRVALRGDPLLDRLSPLLLLSNNSNWLADEALDSDLKFLLKQNL